MEALSVGDTIAACGFGATIIALLFAAFELRQTSTTQRAQFFKELYEPFFLDKEIGYAFLLIEEGTLFDATTADENTLIEEGELFDATTADENKRRKAVERLLAHFEIICSLFRRRLLRRPDMIHFDYNIQRLCLTPGFFEYIAGLETWRRQKGLEQGPYSSFVKYVSANRSRLTSRAA